jgi:hypothetical protein
MMEKAIAEIDGAGGIAVVYEPNERTFILNWDRPGKPVDGAGVHLGMLLQPAMNPIETREAGEYPYPDLYRYLSLTYRRRRALDATLSSMDPQLSGRLRKMHRKQAERFFEDAEIFTQVRNLVLKVPLPAEFDIEHTPREGKLGELLNEIAGNANRMRLDRK